MREQAENLAKLAGTHPTVRDGIVAAIDATEHNNPDYLGRVTEGVRSVPHQFELYLQGRAPDPDHPGEYIVVDPDAVRTNARDASDGPHPNGLAGDVIWIVIATGKIAKDDDKIWGAWGRNVKATGLAWGGDFKSLKDQPHAEMKNWQRYKGWNAALASVAPSSPSFFGTLFLGGSLFGLWLFTRKRR